MSLSTAPSIGSCPDEETLWNYAKGSLPAEHTRNVEAHLQLCSLCAGSLEAAPQDGPLDAQSGIIDERYELQEKIGTGASGSVYRARDRRTDATIALKLFKRGASVSNELLLARRVSHENVCRVFDTGESAQGAYISMEYVAGQTLSERLKVGPPIDNAPAILEQILLGLTAAHRNGIVHRDLKEANILVDPDHRIVVTDFGLARLASQEESRARVVGTPGTWSPEQARGEPATFASDVYSFGVIAYRLLAGQPFKMSNARAFDDVPRRYRHVVERCLAPLPSDRPKDAGEALLLFQKTPGLFYRRPRSVQAFAFGVALFAFALAYILLTHKSQDVSAHSEIRVPVPVPEQAVLSSAVVADSQMKAIADVKTDSSAKPKVTVAPHIKLPQASTTSTAAGRTDLLYGH
jgi:serine/threonine protein kinase